MKFETERLILRFPKKSDWRDIVEGVGDIEVSKNLLVVPHPYKKKDALDWIKCCIKEHKKRKPEKYDFFIVLKSENKVIGVTGIGNINREQGLATTGSWINKKYWRRGFILESKIPVLDFAFGKLGLRKIETAAFVENIASNKMSKKLGFKLEGRKRKDTICKATGKIHDDNIYGLLKEEWVKQRKGLIKKVAQRAKSKV